MAEREQMLVAAVEDVASANNALSMCLRTHFSVLDQTITLLDGGSGVSETLRQVSLGEAEEAINTATSRLFDARQDLRRAIVRASIEDGMSAGELGSMLGISTDRIAAYAAGPSHE